MDTKEQTRPKRPPQQGAAEPRRRERANEEGRPVKQGGPERRPAAGTQKAPAKRSPAPRQEPQEKRPPMREKTGETRTPGKRPAPAGKAPARKSAPAKKPGLLGTILGGGKTAGKNPSQSRRREEATGAKTGARSAAQQAYRQAAASGEKKAEGYQPYRKATERRKAERDQKLRTFFSAKNPMLRTFRPTADTEKSKKKKTPAVIYTEPQAFNRNRLLVQLSTMAAIVLAAIMGMSIFFRVETITVSGADVYSAWTVRDASGISEGDNLLTFGRARASGKIIAALPYVKSARIGIKLPDTVNIEIEEEDVVYAIRSEEDVWWLMNSEGKLLEQSDAATAKRCTQVLGVVVAAPAAGEYAVAKEEVPVETDPAGDYIPVAVLGSQRLTAALKILDLLERNDVVGAAASVDVTRIDDIILWYGTKYQVCLGDAERMDYKIACMNDAIMQMSDYDTGILDVSFSTIQNQIIYTPFS